ncbi:uncharacterized protein LOC144072880 isoform X2 [Stigmatopora argus]
MAFNSSVNRFMDNNPNQGPLWKASLKYGKGKYRPLYPADIVYFKADTLVTVPSLMKVLEMHPNTALGLQYVHEYRSPTKSVPPHYECKLCSVFRLQHDMIAHVRSWKHNLTYLKAFHAEKVPCENEDAPGDICVRKLIKDITIEVAQLEGMGQVKVIMKEPCKVPAFKGARTAQPKPLPLLGNSMRLRGPMPAPLFKGQSFREEMPPNEDSYDDYTNDYDEPNSERFPPERRFQDSDLRTFQDDFKPSNFKRYDFDRFSPERQFRDRSPGPFSRGSRDDFRENDERDHFDSGRFPKQYKETQMGGSLMDRPMKRLFDRSSPIKTLPDSDFDSNDSNPNAVLNYLENFQIENESDAQMVLKVTQKLTELLMEYRLKTIAPDGPSQTILRPSSNLPRNMNRFSRPLSKGQFQFMDDPRRF